MKQSALSIISMLHRQAQIASLRCNDGKQSTLTFIANRPHEIMFMPEERRAMKQSALSIISMLHRQAQIASLRCNDGKQYP